MKILIVTLGILFLCLLATIVLIKKKNIKAILGSIELILVLGLSLILLVPIFSNINYGLDLQGGFEVLYQIEPLEGNTLDQNMVYNTYKAILRRVDILGVSEPEIAIEDNSRIRIALAGVTNKEEARKIMSEPATLSFRDYNDNLLMTSSVLGGSAKVTSDRYGRPAVSLSIKDTNTFYEVTSKVKNMEHNVIVIWLDYKEGEDSYYKEKDTCGSLSSSHCLSAAQVNEAFASDVIIQGSFTKEEAKSLVELINSGALPTKLTEISSRTVDATYGKKSLDNTLVAGIIGLTIVILILIILYHFAGFIASSALSLYTMASFLIFYLIDGTLTLPGIAAMLLGIGMAVDASIITFERIKDQIKIGKDVKTAVKIGNKDSMSSIIDANITTIIVAVILFILGESSVKGFATMLIINIILTILIMVFGAKYVLQFFATSSFFDNHINLFINVPKKKIIKSKEVHIPFQKINFVKLSHFAIPLSVLIIVLGLIFSLATKMNFAVDFTGGTSITLETTKDVKLEKYDVIRTSKTKDSVTFIIKEKLDKEEIASLSNKLEEEYNADSNIFVVSDMVKKELIKNALLSLFIAIIGIIIYVSFRFHFSYAISSVIALVHDVLITIVFFGIFKIEIDSIFVAAILTIIGYSINDTIVTFDMVRKMTANKKELNGETLDNIVNDSVRLTFFRSIMTTITTLVPVIALIIFGGSEILNFNIALLVGFIAGLFSSIFISNGLWIMIEKMISKRPKKEKKEEGHEEMLIKGINC